MWTSITTSAKLINLKNKPPTHHLILYNLTRRTYILTQTLCFVKPRRERSLGFLVQLKQAQYVQHGALDVGAKTVGVLECRKNTFKGFREGGKKEIGLRLTGELTDSGLERLLEMWKLIRFSPTMM